MGRIAAKVTDNTILKLRPIQIKSKSKDKNDFKKINQIQSLPRSSMKAENIYVLNPITSTDVSLPQTQASDSIEYFYNDRGWLIYNNFTYAHRTVSKQSKNTIFWECRSRRYGCKAQIKTVGREIAVVNKEHNHAPFCPKLLKPIIYSDT